MSNVLNEAFLTEVYSKTSKVTGHDPRHPMAFKSMIADPDSFKVYARSLAEGLEPDARRAFLRLARNTRVSLMENSMYQLNPHEVLTLPILRNFYPKLVAKDLVNTMPIDKPDVVKAFVKPKFRKLTLDSSGASTSDWDYNFPEMNADISRGPKWGATNDGEVVKDTTMGTTNILTEMGINPAVTKVHIEKDFMINVIEDSTGGYTVLENPIQTTVDGVFSAHVTHDNDDTDVLSGNINFETGVLNIASQEGNTVRVLYVAHVSLEENTVNPEVRFDLEKIRITVKDRRITAGWSLNIEQDAKSLFDISIQTELINIMGDQIALDIDKEIVTDLFSINSTRNSSAHTQTFYKLPPTSGFSHGEKAWYENIVVRLNELSATIYNDTFMAGANTVACNPFDAAIFEGVNGFEYLGDGVAGGELGYRSATVASGKYKILVSSVVPQGKMLVKYRSNDLARASYLYCPYVPALLIPYPFGNNPQLTTMSRYGTKSIRPEALAQLTISNSAQP